MDNPQEILYWTLTQAQRLAIADRFGVRKSADRERFPDDCRRSEVWLRRLRRRGSIAAALAMARRLHWDELRHTEDTIRLAGAQRWRDTLEHYREQHYRLLAFGETSQV